MELKEFQLNAVKSLFEAMDKPVRDIILKSPTGSGKTIILTYFMHQYIQSYPKTVFVWLTPGKGNLEEQSKAKMDKYIHASQTKLLSDVMTAGFEENDSCFINWEKLTKKGNNALKDSERTNFLEHIEHALNDGLRFIIIVDESHQNNTIKADEIIQYFRTEKIIRCSATPKGIAKAEVIEIPEEEVIAAGLIKKMLVINQDFPQQVEMENATNYLLEQAYAKQREIRAEFLSAGKDINPLIVVQIPNKSEKLQDDVERWFETQGVTYENGQLAVWLSDMHENLDGIEETNAPSVAVIIKQAVATGWDCPRAAILVKLRDNMDETFEIQTIGRIRRMPEAHHYGKDLLDSCYLYTFDEKFTAGVKLSLGKGALEAVTLFLKNEYKNFTLTSEQRTMVTDHRNPKKALLSVAKYFEETFKTGTNKAENQARLQAAGFEFSADILRHTFSGETATLDFASADMNTIVITEKLNTHDHGHVPKSHIYSKQIYGQFQKYISMCQPIDDPIAIKMIDELKDYIGASTTDKLFYNSDMLEKLRCGIVVHHGSMPLTARLILEHFTQQGFCKICFATSTLEQGINMPFDVVYLDRFEERKTLSVKNLIGRAGRSTAKPIFDFGSVILRPNAMSRFRKVYQKKNILSSKSRLDITDDKMDEKYEEYKEAIKTGEFSDEYNLTNKDLEKLKSDSVTTVVPTLLDMMFTGADFVLPNAVAKEVYEDFQCLYKQYLGRELTAAEKYVFDSAIKIMIWKVHGKTFSKICQERYAYVSNVAQRRFLAKAGQQNRADNLPVRYIAGYSDIPDKELRAYPLFPVGTKGKDVDYDRIVYDTYDFLDKLIGFKLSDLFYAIFHQYYLAYQDNRAERLAKYIKYGTEDSTEIWMLRYGFSFEEIEWLKPCVESIDQTEIRFNGEIESLDDFQRSSIAQYLF